MHRVADEKLFTIILTAIVILFVTTINIPNHKLEIITFDVGNADAFLIKTPENKYFIIDTAKMSYKSSSSTAKFVIAKYLKDRGIKNIEGMIITHFDVDHAGGAVDLMEALNIKSVYVNSLKQDSYTVINIFDAIDKYKIKTYLAENNAVIYTEPDLKITTYTANIPDNDNENSIIALLNYKDFDMLFMGDAGVIAFDKIKKDIPQNIEVLKVGHHGGKNVVNKSMTDYLKNSISVISTGPNNFGHPNKITLDILRHTQIYRTDYNNSIKITTDGKIYKINTFNRTQKKYLETESLTAVN